MAHLSLLALVIIQLFPPVHAVRAHQAKQPLHISPTVYATISTPTFIVSTVTSTATVSTSTLPIYSTETSGSSTYLAASPTDPDVVVSSTLSWIDQFLKFQHQSLPTTTGSTSTASSTSTLKSTIKNYGDSQADDQHLMKWTQNIISESEQDAVLFEDFSYKQYGDRQLNRLKLESMPQNNHNFHDFDMNAFIDYLVTEKNFSRKDLEFLKSQNLDHGVDEIERELNKLNRNKSAEKNRNIDIGGEHDLDENDLTNSALVLSQPSVWLAFAYLIFLVFA